MFRNRTELRDGAGIGFFGLLPGAVFLLLVVLMLGTFSSRVRGGGLAIISNDLILSRRNSISVVVIILYQRLDEFLQMFFASHLQCET